MPQENFFKLFHSIRYLLEVICCRHPVRRCFQYFSFVNTRRAKRTQDYLTITLVTFINKFYVLAKEYKYYFSIYFLLVSRDFRKQSRHLLIKRVQKESTVSITCLQTMDQVEDLFNFYGVPYCINLQTGTLDNSRCIKILIMKISDTCIIYSVGISFHLCSRNCHTTY